MNKQRDNTRLCREGTLAMRHACAWHSLCRLLTSGTKQSRGSTRELTREPAPRGRDNNNCQRGPHRSARALRICRGNIDRKLHRHDMFRVVAAAAYASGTADLQNLYPEAWAWKQEFEMLYVWGTHI